jgi:hypothetical protein
MTTKERWNGNYLEHDAVGRSEACGECRLRPDYEQQDCAQHTLATDVVSIRG